MNIDMSMCKKNIIKFTIQIHNINIQTLLLNQLIVAKIFMPVGSINLSTD